MIPHSGPVLEAATTGGSLLVLALVVPLVGVLLAFAAGGRQVERIALATMPLGLAIAVAIAVVMGQTRAPLVYLLGAWAPPLGVALRADGLSAVMMAITALVICAIGVFAHADFRTPAGSLEARAPFAFWILLLAIWGALNTVFLAGDLFTLYVALELVTFAAVPLVCLDGRAETLQAALRYLLFALLGSVLYLVGTVLLYGAYGTLDIVLLSRRVHPDAATLVAAALMTVGLLAKTAVFPLHLWLPPAHAGAPAAGSAVLSALVVKASFFIVVRLWFDVMPGLPGFTAAQLLAGLGGAAIAFGSIVALRQERLKLLIAYSTLAQIGYLFLMFPLAFNAGSAQLESGGALTGGLLQTISHATAKAAMFMAAGLIYAGLGHDRITGLGGVARALPLSVLAFAAGGVALVGVPPSGAYLAKELLLQAAGETEQWWWAAVIQAGGIFTAGYLVLVLAHAFAPADEPVTLQVRVPWTREAAALALALCSLVLGLAPWEAYLPASRAAPSGPLVLKAFAAAFWPIVGGAVLAVLLGRWGKRLACAPAGFLVATAGPLRRAADVVGRIIERADGTLRQWPAAGLSLLVLAILFGAAMLPAR
ncbi:MAG TPA: proton-conducting transporter membrane subunit [Xanthobacteraceae bacterium]|nr:proton-conducting transporter membrane subunit [Xanthobacteraceae bacterium]